MFQEIAPDDLDICAHRAFDAVAIKEKISVADREPVCRGFLLLISLHGFLAERAVCLDVIELESALGEGKRGFFEALASSEGCAAKGPKSGEDAAKEEKARKRPDGGVDASPEGGLCGGGRIFPRRSNEGLSRAFAACACPRHRDPKGILIEPLDEG